MGLEERSEPALLAIVRGEGADRSAYAADLPASAYGWKSWNRPLLALACEAAGSLDLKRIRWSIRVFQEYLAVHPFMGGEQHSVKYWKWIAYPIWVAGGVVMKIWPEAEAQFRLWLRAFVAYLAIGATRGPGRALEDHNLDHPERPRPLIANGPTRPYGTTRFVAWAGKRGWGRTDTDDSGSRDKFTHLDSPARGLVLAQATRTSYSLPRGIAKWERDMTEAILKRFGGTPWMLTKSDVESLRDFLADPNDPRRAAVLLQWVSGYSPQHRVIWRRYEHGVSCLLTEWGESSTAELGFNSGHDDGECIFASAATGSRQTNNSGDTVDPGTGKWVDSHHAVLRRNDGKYEVAVEVPKKYGAHLYDLEIGGGEMVPLIRLSSGEVIRSVSDASGIPGIQPPFPWPMPGDLDGGGAEVPKKRFRCGLCEKIRRLFRRKAR